MLYTVYSILMAIFPVTLNSALEYWSNRLYGAQCKHIIGILV